MKSRWSAVALLTLLPFGAALADYVDLQAPPATTMESQRSVEHESLALSAQHALKAATRASRELGVAIQNARRNQDMMLITCLSEALETASTAHAAATKLLTEMGTTQNAEQARAFVDEINRINQLTNSALQNAVRCEGDGQDGDGVRVTIDDPANSALDPATHNPSTVHPIEPPTTGLPPAQPPTVDVMEPGTDMPTVPPPASPIR